MFGPCLNMNETKMTEILTLYSENETQKSTYLSNWVMRLSSLTKMMLVNFNKKLRMWKQK